MIQKIYTTFISFAFAALTLSSCSDWLDLYPSDEIKEEYLFSSGDGFRTATNGIYRKMATFDLYGSNLTWGILDAWAQSYYMDQAPSIAGGTPMKKIANLAFKNTELIPVTDAMWKAAWNVVANCNELAQQATQADPSLFYGLDSERQMILGEAIGLRAFVQFDLLRIYAPSPSSVGFREDNRTFIPYVNVYPSYINDHQTVSYCLGQIIADLKEAQRILEEVDKESSMTTNYRFKIAGVSQNQFAESRGYRLNYYAVTAELARVYLYAGKNAEAYAEAKKIIDEENKTGYFKASTSSYGFRNGNMKMYDNMIFGLYSPKELVEWDQEINHSSDGANEERYLCLDSEVAKELYGDEKDSDWRFKYQLEEKYYGYYYRTLKYYKQTESTTIGEINNQTIPMIRMSEVYYIAAEAIFDTNPQEAQGYLELVKKGRGVSKKFGNVTNKAEFINLLVNDARREFLGEGQIFYMYKRLNRTMPASSYYSNPVLPTDENMILPKPDSESNI
ncbi:RagB/SusD family nutrient uptake outer membrane protein [Bacteroides congonensis]|uniref:RagB/SusD family nutrient uptake outer membrane protein n=2 Tax=Bacteroides congonensis TaxID=1871006 RepID=UPI0023FA47DC|nr:RagB/SusD family nutrient uptake outer membrane protein [Bacteroides congonensis]